MGAIRGARLVFHNSPPRADRAGVVFTAQKQSSNGVVGVIPLAFPRRDALPRRASLRGGRLRALALLALTSGGARAQLVFDGNLLFNNNVSGTLAGQFVGAAGAGAPACAAGTTAATLGTVTYTHNAYADPLLPTAPYLPGVLPNFQPGAGSPAFGRA